MIKCTSQCTESLHGCTECTECTVTVHSVLSVQSHYIIKLNRPFFRRVKGMNLRVRRSEQKTVFC